MYTVPIPLGHIVERGRSVATRLMRGQYEMDKKSQKAMFKRAKRKEI